MTDTEIVDWLEKQGIVVAGGRWANGCALDDQTLWWDKDGNLREAVEKAVKSEEQKGSDHLL